jgi:carbon-monoxide dehydrogenase large subunit
MDILRQAENAVRIGTDQVGVDHQFGHPVRVGARQIHPAEGICDEFGNGGDRNAAHRRYGLLNDTGHAATIPNGVNLGGRRDSEAAIAFPVPQASRARKGLPQMPILRYKRVPFFPTGNPMDATNNHHHKPLHRVEDAAFIRGTGRYSDDVVQPKQTYACFVRSPHAHARIVSIDTAEALAARGVLAVLTAADIAAAGIGQITRHPPLGSRNGGALIVPPRPSLAGERVMHVGDPVAMVVAESPRAAQDAAELVAVGYEEQPSVVDAQEAIKAGAPQLYPNAPRNILLDWPGPVPSEENEREVDAIIAGAKHVARVSVFNQRLAIVTMEPRGATASYDAKSDSYTLRACSQSAQALRSGLLAVIGADKMKLRVITEDVGGAFGMKTGPYPEYFALLVASHKLGRPVHWMSTRSEAFISDNQGRDAYTDAELALDEDGKFLALRVRHLANQGAYLGSVGAHINTNNFARCLPTVYDIPKVDIGVICVATNTLPIGPYRGAGRPEANYTMERLVEEAARVTGINAVKLRKKNMIPKAKMPFTTPVGNTYDSGDFKTALERALELSEYADFPKRRREAERRKKLRGIGISCFLEHAGSAPNEQTALMFPGGERIVIGLNVQSTGQSHATIFPRLVADRIGINSNQITHRHGDTDLGVTGFASVGSRSAMVVSHSLLKTIEAMLLKGKKIAAAMLEAAESDIAYRNGLFEVIGTDRRVGLFEVAARARDSGEPLDTKVETKTPQTFPNGCHIAEVEIDPQTGEVSLERYTAVDDCGNILDHTVVEAQVTGGLAQGLGQALLENGVYDASGGQLVSGSFMDYAMPRAHHMPLVFRDEPLVVPATTNPLGLKGVGEAGTTGSLAAVMNAIADAVPNGAANSLEMPATPEKVWAACQAGLAKVAG